MKQITGAAERKTQIKSDMLNILGEEIYYRLFEICRGGMCSYAVNVACGEESSTCDFGGDRERATDIYGKIVQNTVTPCTLCDIANDFNKRK